MGVTNATVNLNDCKMSNFHSTRSSSADNTLTVDALMLHEALAAT